MGLVTCSLRASTRQNMSSKAHPHRVNKTVYSTPVLRIHQTEAGYTDKHPPCPSPARVPITHAKLHVASAEFSPHTRTAGLSGTTIPGTRVSSHCSNLEFPSTEPSISQSTNKKKQKQKETQEENKTNSPNAEAGTPPLPAAISVDTSRQVYIPHSISNSHAAGLYASWGGEREKEQPTTRQMLKHVAHQHGFH